MKKPNSKIIKLNEKLTYLFCDIVEYIGDFLRKIGHPTGNESPLFRVLFVSLVMIPLWIVGTAIAICLNIILLIVRAITMPVIFTYSIILVLGTKLRGHLFKVMPKQHFEQGVKIQQPSSLWHRFLAKICTLAGIDEGTCAMVHFERKDGKYCVNPNGCYIRTIAKEHRIVLWHELAHCIEPAAQPEPTYGCPPLMDADHTHRRSTRKEKKADLYAFRRAFRELSREEAIQEVQFFISAMRQDASKSEDILGNDAEWRARLAERYIRRYYQQ